MARKRHLSRIAVMQALFEWNSRPAADPAGTLQRCANELGEMDEAFALTLLEGVLANVDVLVQRIETCAPGWTWQRMDPISRAVLLIGAYELTVGSDAPPPVVMDEAIEVAKEYCSDEAGKFVNGVLNALAKSAPSSPK